MFQENGTTQLLNCNNSSSSAAVSAIEMELPHHHLQIEQCYSNINCGEIQDLEMAHDSSNWQEMMGFHNENGQYHHHHQNFAANFNQMFSAAAPPPPALLASLGLLGDHVNHVYDPMNLFHSLPGGGGGVFTLGGSSNGGFFSNGVDERELYQSGEGGFEFTAAEIVKDKSEKHRRMQLKDKYEVLKSLVPNSSKDRASIVADAIEYITELKITVSELKMLVEKKRFARERLKRPKVEEDIGSESKFGVGDVDGSSSLRSSWLHRKSKNTEVDVRIIDDEVTVKLVQQKRINCLLFVSKVLDELHLDLHHVAGGLIGDYYSYLFNSKICEGSMVYASAVADKLINVVDTQYAYASAAAALPPTTTY